MAAIDRRHRRPQRDGDEQAMPDGSMDLVEHGSAKHDREPVPVGQNRGQRPKCDDLPAVAPVESGGGSAGHPEHGVFVEGHQKPRCRSDADTSLPSGWQAILNGRVGRGTRPTRYRFLRGAEPRGSRTSTHPTSLGSTGSG